MPNSSDPIVSRHPVLPDIGRPVMAKANVRTPDTDPARSVRQSAEHVLRLTASRESLSAPATWPSRPAPHELLGNMLQRLALVRPHAVLVLESIVSDMLTILEP